MAFLDFVKIWDDVLDKSLDEKAAPSLGSVYLNKEDKIYVDAVEFFKRTLITRDMIEALENIVNVFTGKGGNKIILLNSLFGGGKTHTLLMIYHTFNNPNALFYASMENEEIKKRVENIVKEIEEIKKIRLVVIDGHSDDIASGPDRPLNFPANISVKTIWGMIALQLGLYDKVRVQDEKLIAPGSDTLYELLGKEPVLILMDEIVYYLKRYKKAGSQELRDYGEQIKLFFETLAEAIKVVPKAVLVLSMPVNATGDNVTVEDSYKDIESDIRGLYKVVSRVASWQLTPVSPSNISSILKVRIFKEIERGTAKKVSNELNKIYSKEEFKQYFGTEAYKIAQEVMDTYPFHPTYISTLIEIVNTHENLQKTRDAIRLTRKVVRKLYNEKSNAELIMPYYIDIEDNEFQSILLSTDSYRGYISAVQTDIIENTKRYEKPELAKIIAKTIFIKSFVYGDFNKNTRVYPSEQEIILSSYEPSFAKINNIQPSDFASVIDWESNNLIFLVKDKDTGRYWFTRVTTPKKLIDEKAKQVDDIEAIGKIADLTNELLTRTPKEVLSSSRKTKISPKTIFDGIVLEKIQPIDSDDKKYIIAVLLSVPSQSDLEEMIYRTPNGGPRVNANTIYVIFPGEDASLKSTIKIAKESVTCDKITDKDLEKLYADETIRKVMKDTLNGYCKSETGKLGQLLSSIVSTLNKIVYPYYDESTNRNIVKMETLHFTDTIVQSAISALNAAKKYVEDLDFEYLDYLLSKIHVSVLERKVGNILDYFYTNPALPITKEEYIKQALLDGYSKLQYGIKRKDKLYFKKIYPCDDKNCKAPSEPEAEELEEVELDDYIVPPETALEEQLSSLKPEENKVNNGVVRTWYEFYDDTNQKFVKIEEAKKIYDPATLIKLPIVKRIEFLPEGVDIKLEKNEVEVKPEEEVMINVTVEGIGVFKGELKLSANVGEVLPSQFSLDENKKAEKVVWKFNAPKDSGEYEYTLAVYKDSQALKSLNVKVRVKSSSSTQISNIVPPPATKVSSITIKVNELNFKPLSILIKKFGSICKVSRAEFSVDADINNMSISLRLDIQNIPLDDLQSIIALINKYVIGAKNISYTVELYPKFGDYIQLPSLTPDEEKELQKYISYQEYKG